MLSRELKDNHLDDITQTVALRDFRSKGKAPWKWAIFDYFKKLGLSKYSTRTAVESLGLLHLDDASLERQGGCYEMDDYCSFWELLHRLTLPEQRVVIGLYQGEMAKDMEKQLNFSKAKIYRLKMRVQAKLENI